MKTVALFLSGLVLSALVSGPVDAAPVRVRVTARVMEVHDAGNSLEGKVVVGQRINGTYVYNTNTPNLSPSPDVFGEYRPYANEARMRFVIGSFVFESVQPTQGIDIRILSQGCCGDGDFTMTSNTNKSLVNGVSVDSLWLNYRGRGNVTESVALPSVAPILSGYRTKELMLNGTSNVGVFSVRAQIEATELIVPVAVEVSPASGSFVANQRFDAALILPRNSTVANAHAMANGVMLPLTYPGLCQVQPPQSSTGRPALVCAGADSVLPMAAGAPIEWTVELTNGTVLTETVNWDLAQ